MPPPRNSGLPPPTQFQNCISSWHFLKDGEVDDTARTSLVHPCQCQPCHRARFFSTSARLLDPDTSRFTSIFEFPSPYCLGNHLNGLCIAKTFLNQAQLAVEALNGLILLEFQLGIRQEIQFQVVSVSIFLGHKTCITLRVCLPILLQLSMEQDTLE